MKGFLIAALLFPLLYKMEASPNRASEKDWKTLITALGEITPNGTLHKVYPLDFIGAVKPLGIALTLEHVVRLDAYEQPRSSWFISGLQTYVAPEGRNTFAWKPPGRSTVHFPVSSEHKDVTSGSFTLRPNGNNELIIREEGGAEWDYKNGYLIGLRRNHYSCSVTTQGAWITNIIRLDGANPQSLLRARYDDSGLLVQLVLMDKIVHNFAYHDSMLISWSPSDGPGLRFLYEGGLLQAIKSGSEVDESIEWILNPGCQRGDSRWLAPVHLSRAGATFFLYKESSHGFHITASSTGAERSEFYFNPVTDEIFQRTSGGWIVYIFSGHWLSFETLRTVTYSDVLKPVPRRKPEE